MTEMRPIRLRYGPGTSGGSADSAVPTECAMGALLRFYRPVVPRPTSTYEPSRLIGGYDAHIDNRASCCRAGWPRAPGRRRGAGHCCHAAAERMIRHVAPVLAPRPPTSHPRLDGFAAGGNKAFDGSRQDTGLLGVVQYEPLFEWFLAPERAGPPDIDLDIESGRREAVIQFVRNHYG